MKFPTVNATTQLMDHLLSFSQQQTCTHAALS